MKLFKLEHESRRPDGSRYPPSFIKPRDEAGMRLYYKWNHKYESCEEVEACGYDIGAGWNPARCGNPVPCPEHGDRRCNVCDEPALNACSDASGQFVCGAPLCDVHRGGCRRHYTALRDAG